MQDWLKAAGVVTGVCWSMSASAQESAPPAPPLRAEPSPAEQPSVAPATTAPAPVAAPPPASGNVRLQVRSSQPGVAFHYAKLARPNTDYVPEQWTRLCLEACEVELPRGYYRLALSQGADSPVMSPSILEATRATKLEGAYTDRSARRNAGWLVLGIGGSISVSNIALGAGLADDKTGSAAIVGGIAGLLLSLVVGLPLVASSDSASVEIRK